MLNWMNFWRNRRIRNMFMFNLDASLSWFDYFTQVPHHTSNCQTHIGIIIKAANVKINRINQVFNVFETHFLQKFTYDCLEYFESLAQNLFVFDLIKLFNNLIPTFWMYKASISWNKSFNWIQNNKFGINVLMIKFWN